MRETAAAIQRVDVEAARLRSEGKIRGLRPKEWTKSELRQLRVLAKKKLAAAIIAELLGRHVGSVRKKAREIGLILPKQFKSRRNL